MAWLLDTAILTAAYAFFSSSDRLFSHGRRLESRLPGILFLQHLLSVGVALVVPIFAILLYCK